MHSTIYKPSNNILLTDCFACYVFLHNVTSDTVHPFGLQSNNTFISANIC